MHIRNADRVLLILANTAHEAHQRAAAVFTADRSLNWIVACANRDSVAGRLFEGEHGAGILLHRSGRHLSLGDMALEAGQAAIVKGRM